MSHNYLLQTYNRVAERVASTREKMEAAELHSRDWYYWKGRLEALKVFYDYMFASFHPRLPRRLMKQHSRLKFPPGIG